MLDKKKKGGVILQEVDTPVGEILLGAFDNKLCLCDWKCNKHRSQNDNRIKRLLGAGYEFSNHDHLAIQRARQELREYFSGERKSFDVPLLLVGTDFQKRVWQALMAISYGSTVSYMDIARRIGLKEKIEDMMVSLQNKIEFPYLFLFFFLAIEYWGAMEHLQAMLVELKLNVSCFN